MEETQDHPINIIEVAITLLANTIDESLRKNDDYSITQLWGDLFEDLSQEEINLRQKLTETLKERGIETIDVSDHCDLYVLSDWDLKTICTYYSTAKKAYEKLVAEELTRRVLPDVLPQIVPGFLDAPGDPDTDDVTPGDPDTDKKQ